MRNINIRDDLAIINFKGKYYEVNGITKDLIEYYQEGKTVEEISKIMNLETSEVIEYYNEISDSLKLKEFSSIETFNVPLSCQWKITNTCNLKCKHCYIGDKVSDALDMNQRFRIADAIINSSILSVTISGGEALLVPEIAKICDRLMEYGIKVKIFTNGYFLDEFIRSINPNFYQLLTICTSVDGLKDTHDDIRGIGSFDRVIRGINECVKNKIKVITNTVVHNKNKNDLVPLFDTLHRIGVAEIQASKLISLGYAKDNDLKAISEDEYKHFCDDFQKLKFRIRYSDYSGHFLIKNDNETNETIDWKCCAGVSKFTILENGDIVLCPFIPNMKIGNVLDESIQSIWQSEKRIDIKKHINMLNNNYSACFVLRV